MNYYYYLERLSIYERPYGAIYNLDYYYYYYYYYDHYIKYKLTLCKPYHNLSLT